MNPWWSQIAHTLSAEFADITDIEQLTRTVVRLGLAGLLGGLLGWQREAHGKAAGIRTHMLVAMGAALAMLVGQQTSNQVGDLSRVLQGVVAGVGFLGAGTILKGENHGDHPSQVKGLTTAAGIWLTAAIGATAGVGKEVTAILSTGLALGVFMLVPLLVHHGREHTNHTNETNGNAPE